MLLVLCNVKRNFLYITIVEDRLLLLILLQQHTISVDDAVNLPGGVPSANAPISRAAN